MGDAKGQVWQAPFQKHQRNAKEIQGCINQKVILGITAKERSRSQDRGNIKVGATIQGSILVESSRIDGT